MVASLGRCKPPARAIPSRLLCPRNPIRSSRWRYRATAIVGAAHRRIVIGGGQASADKPEFKAINTQRRSDFPQR